MSVAGQLSGQKRGQRLPAEVNSILYVRNLPFKIESDELYDIFGKYGAIRQIRLGTEKKTRGTAYVVYEDIYDAKNAAEHLNGFNVGNRYLSVIYHKVDAMKKRIARAEDAQKDMERKRADLERLKRQHNIPDEDEDEDDGGVGGES